MRATNSQQLGLRKVREYVRTRYWHSLRRFAETPDSCADDSTMGREFLSTCRRCNAYVLVYFPTDWDEATEQGIHFGTVVEVVSHRHGFESKCLMHWSGNYNRCRCGDSKR